jgi:hypothetical protein
LQWPNSRERNNKIIFNTKINNLQHLIFLSLQGNRAADGENLNSFISLDLVVGQLLDLRKLLDFVFLLTFTKISEEVEVVQSVVVLLKVLREV